MISGHRVPANCKASRTVGGVPITVCPLSRYYITPIDFESPDLFIAFLGTRFWQHLTVRQRLELFLAGKLICLRALEIPRNSAEAIQKFRVPSGRLDFPADCSALYDTIGSSYVYFVANSSDS